MGRTSYGTAQALPALGETCLQWQLAVTQTPLVSGWPGGVASPRRGRVVQRAPSGSESNIGSAAGSGGRERNRSFACV